MYILICVRPKWWINTSVERLSITYSNPITKRGWWIFFLFVVGASRDAAQYGRTEPSRICRISKPTYTCTHEHEQRLPLSLRFLHWLRDRIDISLFEVATINQFSSMIRSEMYEAQITAASLVWYPYYYYIYSMAIWKRLWLLFSSLFVDFQFADLDLIQLLGFVSARGRRLFQKLPIWLRALPAFEIQYLCFCVYSAMQFGVWIFGVRTKHFHIHIHAEGGWIYKSMGNLLNSPQFPRRKFKIIKLTTERNLNWEIRLHELYMDGKYNDEWKLRTSISMFNHLYYLYL